MTAPAGEVWIGDDAAVVAGPACLLLAADAVVAGVHADLTLTGLDDLGWKAVAVNVSDIAAMGGRPLHALVTVVGPAGTDLDLLYRGIAEAAAAYDCPVVGGDLSNGGVLAVTVAVTGTVEGGQPVLRRGANAADLMFVTGPLGASAAGLRELRAGGAGGEAFAANARANARAHARPQARVAEGTAARLAGATAMIDISDGLAADLDHLAAASGVGLALYAARIPVAEGATFEEALGGGEDQHLAFTARDADRVAEQFRGAGLARPVQVGRCTADPAERSLDGRPMPATGGWEHSW